MVASAAARYWAIAFDFRGYGLSQQPPEPEKVSFVDLAVDVMGVMDSLDIEKVLLLVETWFLTTLGRLDQLHK